MADTNKYLKEVNINDSNDSYFINATVFGDHPLTDFLRTAHLNYSTSDSNNNYAVRQADDDKNLYVHVPWTDEKVTQKISEGDSNYPVMLASPGQTKKTTAGSYFATGLQYNPSTKILSTETFKGKLEGNAESATKLLTKRSITVDGVSASFDGTEDIEISLDGHYLPLYGGTITGALTLASEPTEEKHAATKGYVDRTVTGATQYLGTVANQGELDSLNPGKGDFVRVSTAFEGYHASDMLVCETPRNGSTAAVWSVIHGEIDTNTWTANSKSAAGYVTKGNGHNNQIWMTDDTGNPNWRDKPSYTWSEIVGAADHNHNSTYLSLNGGTINGPIYYKTGCIYTPSDGSVDEAFDTAYHPIFASKAKIEEAAAAVKSGKATQGVNSGLYISSTGALGLVSRQYDATNEGRVCWYNIEKGTEYHLSLPATNGTLLTSNDVPHLYQHDVTIYTSAMDQYYKITVLNSGWAKYTKTSFTKLIKDICGTVLSSSSSSSLSVEKLATGFYNQYTCYAVIAYSPSSGSSSSPWLKFKCLGLGADACPIINDSSLKFYSITDVVTKLV